VTRKLKGPGARKLLATCVVVGVAGGVVGLGAFSAFTATTTNTGNTISAGTVAIGQHSGSTTLYSVSNGSPGAATTGCVRVTYTGSITASAVKLYVSSGVTNGDKYNLKVERGSGLSSPGSDMNCTGYSASSTAYDGALGSFGTSYAAGVDGKASAATWATNDAVDYRFTITVNDDSTPNAHTTSNSSGSHTFTWEARS
jgi:hypothetical protein